MGPTWALKFIFQLKLQIRRCPFKGLGTLDIERNKTLQTKFEHKLAV